MRKSYETKLGQLIDANAGRDAVHVALAPMRAAEKLLPGEHVGFADPSDRTLAGSCDHPIGIVDPYLRKPVKKDEWFFLCLYPQTTTGLRHVWTHPAFPHGESPAAITATKLRSIIEAEANHAGLDYDEMMAGAHDYARDGDSYLCEGGRWEGHSMLDCEAFWDAYEAITGEKPKYRSSFFSCSC